MVKWGEFSIGSISKTIKGGRDWESYNRIEGSSPFIGSSSLNNGITDFVDFSTKRKYTGSNVIGINRNGNVGYAFYHPYRAYFSGDTRFIELIDFSKNKYVNLFITTAIMQQKEKYAYGYKMGTKRLTAQKILIPITPEGKPDWNYMEQYIVNLMENVNIPKVEPIKSSSVDLNSVTWKEFEIEQLFDKISSVKGKTIDSYQDGAIPYITTSASNNGLTSYVSADKKVTTPRNVITIDPIKGKTFYHVYEFVGRGGAGSAINVLESKYLNKKIGLFIATMIESNSFLKASYGIQLNGKRLRRQKIMLPVTTDNSPHWQFMEEYINSISNSRLI